MEEILPAHVECFRVVAHVHEPLARESFAQHRIEKLINLATVDDRRLTTLRRRLRAVKPDLHRPAMHVRTFVVEEYGFIGGGRGRAPNISPPPGAGEGARPAQTTIRPHTPHHFT